MGEYAFLDDTSCNLASINIYKFYDKERKVFDLDGYVHMVSLLQLMLESSVHWGQFPTEDIARKTYMFRTTGLGIANLASLLMVMGYAYDSEEARQLTASLIGVLTGASYVTSALMAEKVGLFEKYEINKDAMLRVIRNHGRVAGAIDDEYEDLHYRPVEINHEILRIRSATELSELLKELWQEAIAYGEKFGYRNAQVSVIAPTGTISFAMDCGATSIEPYFSHFVYKKLSGGGFMTIVNPIIEDALENLEYSQDEIKDIVDYILRKEIVNENGYEYEKIIDGKIRRSSSS